LRIKEQETHLILQEHDDDDDDDELGVRGSWRNMWSSRYVFVVLLSHANL